MRSKNIIIAVIAVGIIVSAGAGAFFATSSAQKPQTDTEFAKAVFQIRNDSSATSFDLAKIFFKDTM